MQRTLRQNHILLVRICMWICNFSFIAESHFMSFNVNEHLSFYDGNFFPNKNEFTSFSLIHPQIHDGKNRQTLPHTLDAKGTMHLPHIMMSYFHKNQLIQIDLKLVDKLLPEQHFLRYQNTKTTLGHTVQNFSKTELLLCHYQGKIIGKPQSSVAISTCNGGINGLIFDGVETYFIHSHNKSSQNEHFLLWFSNSTNFNFTCGYNKTVDNVSFTKNKSTQLLRHKRSTHSNLIRGPYNANKHSSYVELVIVVDNKVFKSFGENTKKVHQHCKDLANIMNAIYVPLNIFVALIGVVIWNEFNEIEFSNDGDVTLRNFLNYRKTKLVLDHPNDNAQLLTKEQFNGGVVGKALKGPICTHEYSGGVSMEHSQIVAVVATTMAHELGHNFGMEHDSPDCKCQDDKCIMSASSTSVVPMHWSSCSIEQLNLAFSRGMNYCLRNKPSILFDSPQCGNGFVEPGEQCDCGLPNYCENTCCDPFLCMLYSNASCATGECCDLNTCRPKVAGTVCRLADNECDLPEYCTGESEYCPANVFKRDTEDCDEGQAYCFLGDCRSHSNQCRVLWGPTGESSEHCYLKNTEGKRGGNCGFNRLNNSFISCETEHVLCGMLHCRHLNERLEFGMESAAVLSHSFINHEGSIVPCRTALVDLGLQSTDPGLTPNGAKCGLNKICVDQQCLQIEKVRANGMGKECQDNCNNNGICNSLGNCHCDIGYGGVACEIPGSGGSVDSGPATNPNSHDAFQKFMYIFFFLVVPIVAACCCFVYCWRNQSQFLGNKLTDNVIKAANGMKLPGGHPETSRHESNMFSLPKSVPSNIDDMNSSLLKSTSDSNDINITNGMFGKFKGFTLRPLNENNALMNNSNKTNVALVHPTVQDNYSNKNLSQETADLAYINENTNKLHQNQSSCSTNFRLPTRPIISVPILEATSIKLPSNTIKSSTNLPLRPAPDLPITTKSSETKKNTKSITLNNIHIDEKFKLKQNGAIRRLTSYIKKEDKNEVTGKSYIDRDKLKNIQISAPVSILNQNNISEENDGIKVKRVQSMRSPPLNNQNVYKFSSLREKTSTNRPISVFNSVSVRPKSPPPRPPPLLKKALSTTSSGYQLPVTMSKSIEDNIYDDCEFSEFPNISKSKNFSASNDNIYSVIEEIPPAAHTLKRSDLVNLNNSNSSEMGLLCEIVSEIQKRNGESIYSSSKIKDSKHDLENKKEAIQFEYNIRAKESLKLSDSPQNVTTYLRPIPITAPVARVAPTRSDIPSMSAFSTFKPPSMASSNENKMKNIAKQDLVLLKPLCQNKGELNNSKNEPISMQQKLDNATNSKFSSEINKPKILTAKPLLNTQKNTIKINKTGLSAFKTSLPK